MSKAAQGANASMIASTQGVRNMATAFAGGAVAITAVIGVLGTFAKAAMEAEDNANRLAFAVRRKGEAFAYSTDQLLDMASELSAVTRFEDDAIQKAQAILLRFDEIDGSNIREITEATLDFATATGQDAASAAVAFGKALLEPGEGMRALKEVGVTLSAQQQEQIDKWNETGESAKSVTLLLGLLKDKIGGLAQESAQTAAGGVDQLKNSLGDLSETIGENLIPRTSNLTQLIRDLDGALQSDKGRRAFAVWLGVAQASLFQFGPAIDNFKEAWNGTADDIEEGAKRGATGVKTMGEAFRSVAKLTGEDLKALRKTQDEAAKSAQEFADKLQAVLDEVDPVAAEVRALEEKISLVSVALAAGGPNVQTYRDALESLRAKLAEVKGEMVLIAETIPLIEMGRREAPVLNPNPTGGDMTVGQSPYVVEMQRAEEQFTENLTEGMGQAAASFAREFIETGEVNVERLGDMLLDTLLSAAQQYFAQMVANQAKLKMGSATTGTGSSAASSAMGAFSNVAMAAAVVYAVYAITDGIRKANDASKYKETAVAGVYRSGVGSTYAGELDAQGRAMAEAMRGFLNLMQSVAGEWIESLPELAVRVSGDGKKFQALVGGEIVGTFSSMSEAMVRAFQAAFSDATFAGAIDPIIRDMVTNFRGTDLEELKAGLQQVKGLLDEVSGLSDVEIALKDLPFQADAMRQSLVQLGASFEDASGLAAKWRATQLQSLRDQITGHQATEAEQRAQKEREALMFNAELALSKAEIQMKRDKLAAEIEILRAGGSLATADLNLTTQYLGGVGRLTEVKAELLNRDLQIQQGHVNLMSAAGQAALASLQMQLAALDQVFALLGSVKPIDLGEIRVNGGGGGGRGGGGSASAGPSEAEQRAEAFLDFLEGLRLDGLSGYQRALADLNAAFADHAEAASEMEGGEERLAAARRQALADLREDVIDAFGSPMEGLRDRLEEIRQQVGDWYAANNELGAQFQRGEISLQQLLDALAEANVLWAEFGDMARSELLNLALYFTDALGNTEESARIREELAEMEWDFKRLEMQMLIETYAEIGWITAAAADHWRDVLAAIPENRPGNINDSTGGGGSGSLQSAIARLRNAIDALRESNENLLLSEVSPLSTADQFAEAERLYNETLAAAQGGDLQAIEDFASVRDQYLALAAAMYGTAGGGYQSIFQQSLQAGQDLATAGQAILDAIPPQMQGVEDRLDTIAEILAAIEAAQMPVVNPPGGAGDGPPTPPGHPLPPPRPPQPGEDGGYPPGHPGGPPQRPGDSQGFAGGGETMSQLRMMNEQLRQLLAATEEQTRSANSNSLRRVATTGGGRGISVRRGN